MIKARSAVIGGVKVVTIPISHYAELLEAQRQLAERVINHDQFNRPCRSPIERDSEVAVFLAGKLGTVSVPVLRRLCRKTFGASRTPSQQAIYRYWERLRIQARSAANSAAK